jgi:hypothetical protein
VERHAQHSIQNTIAIVSTADRQAMANNGAPKKRVFSRIGKRAGKSGKQRNLFGKYRRNENCYNLSRLTRKGPLEMLMTLKRFSQQDAQVYSFMETWLNVPSESNEVLVAFYGYFAGLFSRQLSARTKAAMARAKT